MQHLSVSRKLTTCIYLLTLLATLMWNTAAAGQVIPVGSGHYQMGIPAGIPAPKTSEPQPPGVKASLVGANGAIQTSDWWTSLIFKWSAQPSQVQMNRITPGPLALLSTFTGVACRQWYYKYDFLTPLNQGPALRPDELLSPGVTRDFREVWVGVGIANGPYGVDALIYPADGESQPRVMVTEYSTWAMTYDTLYKDTPPDQAATGKPRLRATAARGAPYLWIEYPDGFPGPTEKPGYPYQESANYPMLQATQDGAGNTPAPILYLPPNFDTPTAVDTNWVGNGGTGTQSAGVAANAVAFTINGRNYAAFGPPGTHFTWIRIGRNLSLFVTDATYNDPNHRPYIVVAALPQNLANTGKTLAQLVSQFKTYAFKRPGNTGIPGTPGHIWGTMFQPAYNTGSTAPNNLTGTFTYNLVNVGAGGAAPDNTTLFALFPHQQGHLRQTLGTTDTGVYASNQKYTSSRGLATSQIERDNPAFSNGPYNGQMRLAQGTGFTLQYTLSHIMPPVLPQTAFKGNLNRLKACLKWDYNIAWGSGQASGNDSYGWGKLLSAVANNYMLAQNLNYDETGGITQIGNYLRDGLVQWLDCTAPSTTTDHTATGFAYDADWNMMFPYPPGVNGADGFGVITFLNDQHFHYGYFIRAAAVYADYNPAFVTQYGKMVEHLIRNLAADYNDQPNGGADTAVYPPYRFFDVYAGSSSAAGVQQYGDGMNQESSSEGVNAWYGMLLWAQVTKNQNMLARAAYMYASETDAAQRYVFCEDAVTNRQFALASNTFSMLYDDSNQLQLFFTSTPGTFSKEAQHIINWLPFGGGALYLALNPAYAGLNYTGLLNQTPPGNNWAQYPDLIWMYRAISNPGEAQAKVNAVLFPDAGSDPHDPLHGFRDNGNSLAMLYHWIYALPNLGGQPLLGVTSSHPLSGVFTKRRLPGLYQGLWMNTYTAYNHDDAASLVVRFSDGTRIIVPPDSYRTKKRLVHRR